MTDDHAPNAERISRRLGPLVEERTHDVARAIAQEQHRVRDDFLRVAGRVRRLQGEHQDEGRVVGAREVVGDETPGLAARRQEGEAEGAGDVREEEKHDDVAAALLPRAFDPVVEEDAAQDAHGDQNPVGHLHQGRHERREAKALDDDGAEVRDAAVGDVAHDAQHEEKVEFWVQKRLADLVRFEMFILDPCLVVTQAVDSPATLCGSQERRRNGRVGQEDEEDNAPDAAKGANDQELELPAWE